MSARTEEKKTKIKEKESQQTIKSHPRPLYYCGSALNKNAAENFLKFMSILFIYVIAFVLTIPQFRVVSTGATVTNWLKVWMCLLSEAIDKFNVAYSHKYFLKGYREPTTNEKSCQMFFDKTANAVLNREGHILVCDLNL